MIEPIVGVIGSGQVTVPGVVIDPNRRRFHQIINTVQALKRFAILLMRLQADLDA
jgi:hypothetical protein